MENEIKKLKREYVNTKPSEFLETQGLADMWTRIDHVKQVKRPMYPHLSRFLVFSVLIIIGLAGFISVTYASTPGSLLYQVKRATQEVVKRVPFVPSVSQTTVPTQAPSLSPTLLPIQGATTTPMEDTEKGDSREGKKIDNPGNEDSAEVENEEVRGVSTVEKSNENDNKNESRKRDERKTENNGRD